MTEFIQNIFSGYSEKVWLLKKSQGSWAAIQYCLYSKSKVCVIGDFPLSLFPMLKSFKYESFVHAVITSHSF